MFNSVSRIEKRINSVHRIHKKKSILWVGFTKSSILWVFFYWWKNFESWKKRVHFFESKIFKKVQVFESRKKEGSSVWVMWKKGSSTGVMKKRKEQFFQSNWAKKSSLSHIFNKKFNPLSDIQEGFNSFNSFIKKLNSKSNLKKFHSVSQLKNKAQLCESDETSSILWVMFKKGSNIWLIFPKANSVNHIKKRWVQFFNHIGKILSFELYWKSSIDKMFISSSHMLKRVQFFESNWKEGFHSVSHSFSKKKFNSWVIF